MGTISRDSAESSAPGIRPLSGIQAKFLLSYIALSAVVLCLLNILPLTVSRDLTFASKSTSLMNQAYLIGASAESVDNLSAVSIARVMSLLDTSDLDGVVITDSDALLLYDSRGETALSDSEAFSKGFSAAFSGQDRFYSSFRSGVFSSTAAVPIMHGEDVAGAVIIYQYDEVQGGVITGLCTKIQRISVCVMAAAVILAIIMSKTLSGRLKRVLEAIQTVRDGEYGYRISVTGHDELAVIESEFNAFTDRLEKTESARRRFVSDASHELKTPLASIRLLADSIAQSEGIDASTVREFAGDIGSEAERLTRTTEKLLSLTRFDNGICTARERVNIYESAMRVVKLLKPLSDSKNVTVECICDGDCCVLASEDDIYQIVFNLTENAIKYNVPGGSVKISVTAFSGQVALSVSDTGIGIPDDDLPHIFERFYRVDKARAREAGGSGLGLSIVSSAVREHGGDISARRQETGGMRFTAVFPYCPASGGFNKDK